MTPRKENSWTRHVRAFQKAHNLNYSEALNHKDISKGYKKMSGAQKKASAKRSAKKSSDKKKRLSKKSTRKTKKTKKTTKKRTQKKTTKKRTQKKTTKKTTQKRSKKGTKKSTKKSSQKKKGLIPVQLVPWFNYLAKYGKSHPNLTGVALKKSASASWKKLNSMRSK